MDASPPPLLSPVWNFPRQHCCKRMCTFGQTVDASAVCTAAAAMLAHGTSVNPALIPNRFLKLPGQTTLLLTNE